jgi:manganese/zinc/iron transport system permease protein
MSSWELMLRIGLLGAVCNVSCAVLGCYLVLRRMSLLGDAISHAVLPGIALGFLLTHQLDNWLLFAGAMGAGVLTALLTQTLHRYGGVPEDASLGAVFTALFAVGVLLINTVKADLDPGCVLYGQPEYMALDTVNILGLDVPQALG